MKRIIKFLLLLATALTTVFIAHINPFKGALFPICCALSIMIIFGTLGYFTLIKKQKILFIIPLILSICCMTFVLPAFADNAGNVDAATSEEWRNKISAAGDAVDSDSEFKKYYQTDDGKNEDYVAGYEPTTFNPDTADAAIKALDYCEKLQILERKSDSLHEKCKKIEQYNYMVAKIKNLMGTSCSPITSIIKNLVNKNECWPCDVTALVLVSIQKVTAAAYEVLRPAALSLLGVLTMLWLAYVTLAFFGKFGFARISEYLTNVLNKIVLVLVISAILTNNQTISSLYRFTISPVVAYSASLAQEFSESGRRAAKNAGSVLDMAQKIMSLGASSECSYCKNRGDTSSNTLFLDSVATNSILCMICTVYHQVAPMIALGQGITCFAGAASVSQSDQSALSAATAHGVTRLGAGIVGIFLIIMFSLIMLLIAFHVLSSILQLGFVLILLPLWLIAFVFKGTREYLKNAWALLMHAVISLVAISISTALIIIGFSDLLSGKLALALGWAMVKGSPNDILSTFTGELDQTAQAAGEGGSMFSGLTDSLIQYGIDSLIGVSPMQAVFLLVAFAFLSVSMINAAPELVERLFNLWLGKSIDAQGMMMDSARTAMKGVGVMSSSAKLLAGAGALGLGYMNSKTSQKKVENAQAARIQKYEEEQKQRQAAKEQTGQQTPTNTTGGTTGNSSGNANGNGTGSGNGTSPSGTN
ncbi:MAG: hypothetical protein IJC11_06385 [Alphaproteobacteria bacterium]|nr:hypothetical protein [Alphaproteobacteria bacterium]